MREKVRAVLENFAIRQDEFDDQQMLKSVNATSSIWASPFLTLSVPNSCKTSSRIQYFDRIRGTHEEGLGSGYRVAHSCIEQLFEECIPKVL